jgi:type IV pilus assembly protein PilQ
MVNNKRSGAALAVIIFCACLLVTGTAAKESADITVDNGKVFLNLKDAEIKSVLQIFARATGINIVASDDVAGKITVSFSGISPKDGLEAVLRTKGLDWFEDHGTIFVSTKKILRTYYLANAKPSDLQTTITSVLPAGSVVTADDSYNVLVIQTTSDYLPRLEKLINELDVPPVQVMVETKMIEIQDNNDANLGANISYGNAGTASDTHSVQTTGQAGQASDDGAQGLYAHALSIFTSGSLEAFLSALATSTKLNVVATPKLTTLNNKEAHILIGSKLGYKTTTVSSTSTTQTIDFLEVGTTLSIKPNVTKNGYIRMVISPKVSDGTVVDDIPDENTTETMNEVMVKDGQTFVIGGLTKEQEVETNYGVPLLMDVPLIGGLFRKTVTSKQKTELLVFVTPHIITPEYLDVLNKPIQDLTDQAAREKANLIH